MSRDPLTSVTVTVEYRYGPSTGYHDAEHALEDTLRFHHDHVTKQLDGGQAGVIRRIEVTAEPRGEES